MNRYFTWLFLMPLLSGSSLTTYACSPSNAPAGTEEPAHEPNPDPRPQPGKGRCLVVYFSCTGKTKGIAEQIADITNGEICRIVPETAYTAANLDYNNPSSRANREQNDVSARPAISGEIGAVENYDIIFLGYPIWWGKAPKVIYTFLESYGFSGKTVIPFCTSGSSGVGSSDTDLHTSAPKARWEAGRRFSAGAAKKEIENWIESMGLDF